MNSIQDPGTARVQTSGQTFPPPAATTGGLVCTTSSVPLLIATRLDRYSTNIAGVMLGHIALVSIAAVAVTVAVAMSR
jgi:hypothetical protein